jgi:hypothetical protein
MWRVLVLRSVDRADKLKCWFAVGTLERARECNAGYADFLNCWDQKEAFRDVVEGPENDGDVRLQPLHFFLQ